MQIVLATGNPDKLEEIIECLGAERLSVAGIKLITTAELNITLPEETGQTLEENATIKAEAASLRSGMMAIADDTGLFVETLQGEPGIRSARYAGEKADYKENRDLLLQNLSGSENRKAYFRTALTCVKPESSEGGSEIFTVLGEIHGTILTEPRGDKGFGYDCVFLPESSDKTFAEMSLEEKREISHRGKAIRAFQEKMGI